jgi:hypothetical protein
MLHRADYSNGRLLVLTVPDNFIDLYNLPVPVLNMLRQQIAGHMGVTLEGSSEVALLLYDNHSFVVESFLDEPVDITLVLDPEHGEIQNLATGESIYGTFREAPSFRNRIFGKDGYTFEVRLKPHSFIGFSSSKKK